MLLFLRKLLCIPCIVVAVARVSSLLAILHITNPIGLYRLERNWTEIIEYYVQFSGYNVNNSVNFWYTLNVT